MICAVVGIALFAVGYAAGSSNSEGAVDDQESIEPGNEAESERSETTASPNISIGTDDVSIDVVVLDESCFDSAGSLMEVELSPARAAGADVSLDQIADLSFRVTYDITNTEGGVTRGSFLVERGQFVSDVKNLSFANCNVMPNIVVTGVSER
jgi:hypothetical protein